MWYFGYMSKIISGTLIHPNTLTEGGPMAPLDELKNCYSKLTLSEQKAASFILENTSFLITSSLTDLANRSGSSNSAIIRLCQKMGYQGFSEFKFAARRQMLSTEPEDAESDTDPMQQLLNVYIDYINQIPAYVRREDLITIARCIVGARNRCSLGINRTFLPASQLSLRLNRIGYLSTATDDFVLMADQASLLRTGDVLILYSQRGLAFSAYAPALETAKNNGVTVILVTMAEKTPLAKHADYTVTLPCISQHHTSHFYEDQIIFYLFNELLLTEISKLS